MWLREWRKSKGGQVPNIMLKPTTSERTAWTFPATAWVLSNLDGTSKRLNLPCTLAIPSPSLSLVSRHIHFPPHLNFPLETASSVTPALGSSAGCRWVLLSPKASPQDIRGTATLCTKARGIQPMVTVPAAQRNPQSSTSACVHVSRMLKC